MTLADSIHVGDQFIHRPSWVDKNGQTEAKAEKVEVVYTHPLGRYCIVKLPNGLTDTIPTVPEEKAAQIAEEDKRGGYQSKNSNYIRARLKGLHVRQSGVSEAMGHSTGWLGRKLSTPLSIEEQREIIQVAEELAARKAN